MRNAREDALCCRAGLFLDFPNPVHTPGSFPSLSSYANAVARHHYDRRPCTLETTVLPRLRHAIHPISVLCSLARRRYRLQHTGPGRQCPRLGMKHANAQGLGKIVHLLNPHAMARIPPFPTHRAPDPRSEQPLHSPGDLRSVRRKKQKFHLFPIPRQVSTVPRSQPRPLPFPITFHQARTCHPIPPNSIQGTTDFSSEVLPPAFLPSTPSGLGRQPAELATGS